MTQEMKLLMALTEALGFEIDTTLDYDEQKESEFGKDGVMNGYINHPRCMKYNDKHGTGRVMDMDGMYKSMLKAPIVDYKVRDKQ